MKSPTNLSAAREKKRLATLAMLQSSIADNLAMAAYLKHGMVHYFLDMALQELVAPQTLEQIKQERGI